jgi:hypothetical protein
MPNVSAFESRCFVIKRLLMFLLALLLSVSTVHAQAGFQIGIYSWAPAGSAPLVLNPLVGAQGGTISQGARYVAKLLFGNFPTNPAPIVYVAYEQPGGQGVFSNWYQFQSFLTPNANEVAFIVPVPFTGPRARVRIFMPSLNAYTATTELRLDPTNPAVYACNGTQNGFFFQTPHLYGGTTLPYSGGPLYTTCTSQNSTQIPRGGNIILGGTGLAGYNFNYSTSTWDPWLDNPTMVLVGNGTVLPFIGFYETPDHQQQLMFQVPASLGASSQQVALTINGKTAYFIVTFI